jgi:glycosyltransferase involved in cell wall biosynthesis
MVRASDSARADVTDPKLRLLFLTPFAPDVEGSHGGARATGAIIQMLASRHEVSVLYPRPEGAPPARRLPEGCRGITPVHVPPIRRRSKSAWRKSFDVGKQLLWSFPDWAGEVAWPQFEDALRNNCREIEPDAVHFEYHVMSRYIPLVKAIAPEALRIVTEHEPGVVADRVVGRRSGVMRRLGDLARRRAWTRFERSYLPLADAVVTFTPEDRQAVAALVGADGPHLARLPLRLPLAKICSTAGQAWTASDLLFIGYFEHPPNLDAALRLARAIFPQVRKAAPAATLAIVGAAPPPELLAAAGNGVTVTGWVDSVAPYLAGASVVVAPLRQGGGMRVKVIEACGFGKALVASATAVKGLSLVEGRDFVLADSDEAFASSIVHLLSDADGRERLGAAARQWAERELDPDVWAAEYDAMYRLLIGSRRNAESFGRQAVFSG